nr:hypothetical protein CFP56_50297 [Quercus suber]
MFTLSQKIKECRKQLLAWKKTEVQARPNAFARKQAHLQICEQDLNDETKRDEAKKLRSELNILLEQEEAYWQQRSRVNWLQNGNLQNGSNFQSLFSSSNPVYIERVTELVESVVTDDMNSQLLKPFIENEPRRRDETDLRSAMRSRGASDERRLDKDDEQRSELRLRATVDVTVSSDHGPPKPLCGSAPANIFLALQNPKKSLNLAKATVSHHPNSALALGALSCCHLKLGFIARKDPKLSQDSLHKLDETIEHFKNSIHLSKRAVLLCPGAGCLTFWCFHVSALFSLAEYDANAQLEAVIEACDASLAIEYPTVMEDSLYIYDEEDRSTESRIEDLRKNLRVFKIQSIYMIDAESLRKIKNEIQELQDRKEEIEQARYTVAARVKAYCERFFEAKLNADHMKSVHLGTLSDELRSVEPEIVLDSVNDNGESRKWRPVDVVAAKKMMEDLSRNKREDEGLNES